VDIKPEEYNFDSRAGFSQEKEFVAPIRKLEKKRGRKRTRLSHKDGLQIMDSNHGIMMASSPNMNFIMVQNDEVETSTKPTKRLTRSFSESQKSTKPPVLHVNFTREELLNLTSEEFEEHIQRIANVRPLSGSEKVAIKRQRRLIKNRESAQASRQRKKDYVGELEKKVGDLESGNSKLKEQYSSLTAENRELKNEVEFLVQLVRRVKVH